MAHIIYDPATTNDASPRMAPGTLVFHEGNWYRYVQFKDAIAYAANQAVGFSAGDGITAVTNDVSEDNGVAAGVCLGVMTENYYGFIALTGVYTMPTNGDDDIAAGDTVTLGGDGTVNSATTATGANLGVAMADDDNGANTVSVLLRGLI